jgi:hypothetical protein
VVGINNSGVIVGFYYDSAGNGHGYEATPRGKSDVHDAAAALAGLDSAHLGNALAPGMIAIPRLSASFGLASPAAEASGHDGSLGDEAVSDHESLTVAAPARHRVLDTVFVDFAIDPYVDVLANT